MMKIAILGFGLQGRSSYNYYRNLYPKSQITICDQNIGLSNIPDEATVKLGSSYLHDLDQFDVLIRTPFLHPKGIIQANSNNQNILEKITTASNQFLKIVQSPVIGVTGTKGKGTTCILINAILKQAGLKTLLMGNIGIPPLDTIDEAQSSDVIIFEIASFQTMDLNYSPHIGVCLNMHKEHLDWHTDYAEYLNAKAQLFIHQNANDIAIYAHNDKDSYKVIEATKAQIKSYSATNDQANVYIKDKTIYADNQPMARTEDIKLPGQHNWQNVCAAISASIPFLPTIDRPKIIQSALRQTSQLDYRLQLIKTINQVDYINDSYATTPEATIAALQTIKNPAILIVGGSSKQADMKPLTEQIMSSNIKTLIILGETGQEIKKLLPHKSIIKFDIAEATNWSMTEIINYARKNSQAGDCILLSPASASFGLFKNATDRGKQFTQAIEKLTETDK